MTDPSREAPRVTPAVEFPLTATAASKKGARKHLQERREIMIHQDRERVVRRALALLGVAALTIGGVVATGSAVQAAEPEPPSIANIVPPAGGGSIVVHKHAGTPMPGGNGTLITDPAKIAALGVGLDDVKFKIERISYSGTPIDLSTAAGWGVVSTAMVPADIIPPYSKVFVEELTTAGGGLATFDGLPMGLYLVTETAWPAGATPAEAFLVTVPYPNSAANSWLYDVHVYPKNRLADNPQKTVSDPTWLTEGDEVTWTLDVPVPLPTSGPSTYTVFTVTDALDSRLGFVAGSATVLLNGSTVPAGNYVLTEPSAGNSNTLTVAFDATKVRAGQSYKISFKTAVNGSGEIKNTAIRNTNGVLKDVGPEQVNFAKVKVTKLRAGTNLTLQGAQFELWKGDKSQKLLGPETTNSSGVILFDAIGVGKGADKTESVCLKETVPPPGYLLSGDGWTCFTLDAGVANATVEKSIENIVRESRSLPLTGSTGTVVFMAGGLALLAIAVGAALIASRRKGVAAKR